MAEHQKRGDLVLAPNEYAYISDGTTGQVVVIVGPKKEGLTDTDQPVYFDERKKKFLPCSINEAIQTWATAPEGWYLVLKNPAADGSNPPKMKKSEGYNLDVGRKVNVCGPASFPLYPGQMVRVRQGHHLRTNQYLVCRVYDEDTAMKGWEDTVVKPQTEGDEPIVPVKRPDLSMGKLFNVIGTQTSFFIPGSGIEVIPDDQGHFVRDAVTLERLEYAVLIDESGDKRYKRGPAVVFPEPTQRFLKLDKSRKFKAIDLNHLQGIYVKVIKPYTEGGKSYNEGDELFISGKEQMVYWPREEHALVRYAGRRKHFAVAVPAGEGRYMLDRNTGTVGIAKGPQMLLPDPRNEVIVRRIISKGLVPLIYPGNAEAARYNEMLASMVAGDGGFVTERQYEERTNAPSKRSLLGRGAELREKDAGHVALYSAMANADAEAFSWSSEKAVDGSGGDQIDRSSQFTEPHVVTLSTKYDGVVSVDVWTGYAMLLVSKHGSRRVIEGPQTVLLEYDENPEVLTLTGGTPKGSEPPTKTVFLRTRHNKVSDRLEVETSDLCRISIDLSLRVNFEGDSPEAWFSVEDYTKFLTDHVRSMLRNVAKEHTVNDFYADSISIIRDSILGVSADGGRTGMVFSENGMRVYDVDVLNVVIQDRSIAALLTEDKTAQVKLDLRLRQNERELKSVQETERVNQATAVSRHETKMASKELEDAIEEATRDLKRKYLAFVKEGETVQTEIVQARLAHEEAEHAFALKREADHQALKVELMEKEAVTYVQRAAAVSDKLVAAMQQLGDKLTLRDVVKATGVPAYVMGDTVPAFLRRMFQGTKLENVLSQGGMNGESTFHDLDDHD